LLAEFYNRPVLTGSCCLIIGAILPLAFSPFGYYFVGILSPAILFFFWLGATPKQAFTYGYLYGFGMFGTGVNWLHISINLFGGVNLAGALLLTLLLIAFLALYPALVGLIACRSFINNRKASFLVLILPALWTLAEWCREWVLTGFPWLNLGNSQIDSPLAGLAPVLGVYGISFAVCLSAGCLINLIITSDRGKIVTLASLLMLWLASHYLYQHDWTRMKPENLSVTLIQGAIPQELKWKPEQRQPTFDLYLGLSEPYWDSDIIVWPETAIPAFYHQAKPFIDSLDAVAELHDMALLTGIPYKDMDKRKIFNSILLLGKEEGLYHKHHLVPFGEYLPLDRLLRPFLYFLKIPMSDFSPGTNEPVTLDTRKASIGVTICYEDAFGKEVIKTLPQATLLLNVSNDAWFGDSIAPHQHLQIAQMRALETGRYLLRATNTGISAVINEKGKIIARSPQFTADALSADVLTFQGITPYVITGNWTIVISCLMIVLFYLYRLRKERAST
jgi:apolipoprotein N-acyltransferase